jgi:hypothetical protein
MFNANRGRASEHRHLVRGSRRRKLFGVIATASTALGALAAVSTPASALPPSNAVAWQNQATGGCIDDSQQYGLRSFPCNAASYDNGYQAWISPSPFSQEMQNVATGQCIDDSQQYGLRSFPCNAASYDNGYQQWRSTTPGTPPPPPAPPATTPTPTTPAPAASGTTTLTTPAPPPPTPHAHRHRILRVNIKLAWRWSGLRTRLVWVKLGPLPARAVLKISCHGPGCPRRPVSALTDRSGSRLLSHQEPVYRAGDRLLIRVSAPSYVAERGEVWIRRGRIPVARLLS